MRNVDRQSAKINTITFEMQTKSTQDSWIFSPSEPIERFLVGFVKSLNKRLSEMEFITFGVVRVYY